ncbi:hypothetical protein VC83_03926 [Pseudogymnoascus destructans]|uniref:AAA+ ATPase domain-containing protein n=2 Tax=Pseudogymnoascus destructans TaxID=655981 RepID=L8G4D8_PSED2|nr:uncharacterized protein VC83_03926 [Pseudogymnoascus destructans]ELR06846.1 hypothetical protein GMDG_08137 [Pseudogymnoascus destructans 20631-21]OAF59712.1 hypothetical protein VC83_03926 [Pseudogymnoascus destructans]
MAQINATQLLEMLAFPWHPFQALFLDKLGRDMNAIMGLFFLFIVSGYYGRVFNFIEKHFWSSVSVDQGDDLYDQVMSWISEQKPEKHSKTLSVRTVLGKDWNLDIGPEEEHRHLRMPAIQVTPAIGSTFYLRHKGHRISFRRDTIAGKGDGMKAAAEKEVITLRCFSTSPQPCRDLIDHIRLVHYTQCATMTTTTIRKPSEFYNRRLSTWTNSGQKECIIKDMEDYLNSSDMYTASGVPYRRGYLFHGPPGTGKTSFASALAGHLKADIHKVNLNSSEVDDELLIDLVANLRKGSILLIEDIDSAGLTRDDTPDSNDNFKSRITLAGFLNAIDGIASSQGHILIMTTNCRSKLDDAILRPGRVDIEEYFGNASKDTAKNMFIRMCSSLTAKTPANTLHPAKSIEEVRDLAMKFAEHIDDKKFSPAQIQGFLLQRRDPEKACADISDWVKAENAKLENMVGEPSAEGLSDNQIQVSRRFGMATSGGLFSWGT